MLFSQCMYMYMAVLKAQLYKEPQQLANIIVCVTYCCWCIRNLYLNTVHTGYPSKSVILAMLPCPFYLTHIPTKIKTCHIYLVDISKPIGKWYACCTSSCGKLYMQVSKMLILPEDAQISNSLILLHCSSTSTTTGIYMLT